MAACQGRAADDRRDEEPADRRGARCETCATGTHNLAMSADATPSVFRVGGISYLEIPCSAPVRAAAFYEAVFGWTIRRDSDKPAFADATGHVIGHFIAGQVNAADGGIRPYVYVDDVDQTLRNAAENGGETVMQPRPEGTLRVATLRDPEGNVVGVWTQTAQSSPS
jgi:predicted enzyme related to lactoylglutathione lyase